MFWGVDAEEGQAAGQHRPGGFGKREPGTVGGRGFLVTQRKHGVLEGEHRVGGGDEMPGETVGRTVAGGGGEDVGVGGEGVDEVCRLVLYVAGGAGETEGGGVAAEGPGAGVGVPDPEEGVGLPLGEVVRGDAGVVVRSGVQQGPAGSVAAEGGGVLAGRYGPHVDLERRRRGRGAVGVDTDTEDGCPGRVGLVLAGSPDEGALGAKNPGDGLSGGGGAYFAGVVELYEFPGELVDDPVPRATPENLGDEGLLSAPVEGDVEETGPGDVDAGHAFRVREMRPQDPGDLLRRAAGGAGQPQGDVRGVVPAAAGPRGHDLRTLRHRRDQLTRVHRPAHCTQDGTGELDGGHGTSVGEEGGGQANGFGEGPGCGRWGGGGDAGGRWGLARRVVGAPGSPWWVGSGP